MLSTSTHLTQAIRLVMLFAVISAITIVVYAQGTPSLVDSNLRVRAVVEKLNEPTTTAFLSPNEFLVLEKATGQVKWVMNGVVLGTALDLAVTSGSERGLLGIALHPNFAVTGQVYLYWTESTTGVDTTVLSETPLLGNRVDRFVWNGSTLTFDRNIIQLRALQPPFDAEQTPTAGRGNHDGGVIKFGPDGKLYIFIGDVGRRGWMQNLLNGPYQPGHPMFGTDDNFGGPEPDDAHLTGVILRLNDDGTSPADNPFAEAGHVFVARLDGAQEVPANASTAKGYAAFTLDTAMTSLSFTVTITGLDFTGTQTAEPGGEVRGQIEENSQVTDNIHKVFSYGHRNSFGFDFDPKSGNLWLEENGDDTFTELNLVQPGMNGGWIQVMGPLARIDQFKQIETTMFGSSLQQSRWPPTNIADSPEQAQARMVMLPGAHYSDPEFSWKFEVAPAGVGFMAGGGIGPQYDGNLFVGAARPFLEGGFLWRLRLTGNRRKVAVDDPRLEDRVADNLNKPSATDPAANAQAIVESESLLFGRNFGVVTDIKTGPNGNLFLVSLSNGAIYEISRR